MPGGIDFIWRLTKADRRNQVPNELEAIYADMGGVNTWQQSIFGSVTYLTVDPKNIQALLATQFPDFEIGPMRRGNFFPLLGNGIFTSDGKAWEHSRGLLRPQFSRDQVGDLELEETHVQNMFKHLVVDSAGWTPEVNLSPLLFRLTIDSATEFLFGQSVDSQVAALPNEAAGRKNSAADADLDWSSLARSFDEATHALGIRGRLFELYWLYSPISFHDNCKVVHKFADHYVKLALNAESSESTLEKGEKKGRYIFSQELAKATRDPIELRSQLLNILLAGRDTTAGLLGWTFWLLARHPETFDKLRSIILDTFGSYDSPRNISFATLKGCSYLQQVMSEVLRLFPSVPINSRRATKDTTIPRGGGPDGMSPVYVPKGTEVNYSVHIMHRRTDIWGEDALEFKPERWTKRKSGWEFLPFNGGPRICLGQQFALTEAGYVIVRMLQRFDRIENLDTKTEPFHQYSVTTAPLTVPLRLHERLI
ncbi:hypothetical protein H2201_007405 [Coniosporium apollinis]|uniref:Cytochrome P450 n=1 Tax=Coniosporium apollinis TaxID=61459 RepID=A0ABQ9NJJ9_9PEZI|nr:hypothetical protein H2201_007405 [Coniosporium apollinis]